MMWISHKVLFVILTTTSPGFGNERIQFKDVDIHMDDLFLTPVFVHILFFSSSSLFSFRSTSAKSDGMAAKNHHELDPHQQNRLRM